MFQSTKSMLKNGMFQYTKSMATFHLFFFMGGGLNKLFTCQLMFSIHYIVFNNFITVFSQTWCIKQSNVWTESESSESQQISCVDL
jgi:hypothetical protein